MIYIARSRIYTIVAVCLGGLLFALPNVLSPTQLERFPDMFKKTINLGLELRGGSHLQFEVDLKAVAAEQLTALLDDVRSNLRKEQIGYTGLTVSQDKATSQATLSFILRDPNQAEQAQKLVRKIDPTLQVKVDSSRVLITISEEASVRRNKSIIEQSIEVIRRRIDESGTKEPIIQMQGNNRIIVQLPGVDNPGEVKRLVGQTAKMSFRLVEHSVGPVAVSASGTPIGHVPPGCDLLPEIREDGRVTYVAVKRQVMVSGETLVDAQATVNQNGQPAVSLKFNTVGARKFAQMSGDNIKKQFAIVLDDKVISAPVFQDVIPDGNGQISGHFTIKDANDLALLLRAGALPAPLNVIEERTVGPSLGADSIQDGKTATVLAFILVSIFMILNYSVFGIFANIALVFNIIFLFAGLSLLQATLTLPGIAGIALTIGMAVDANVLIYERIKEEIRNGMKAASAIEAGYQRAMTTILDSNLTTLIGTAVLFEFGTGPIRGFAVTLALGIVISLFTALSLTRLIIAIWMRKRKLTTLPI